MKKAGFTNISIIGVGLIGGSLGLALKKNRNNRVKVKGIGRHIEKLKVAEKLGAIDSLTTDFKDGVKDADIVVIASPVNTIALITKKITAYVKPGCIITDTGSVKGSVIGEIEKYFRHFFNNRVRNTSFVGSHPLAGSEKTGVKFARHDLFRDATVAVIPLADSSLYCRRDVRIISDMWVSADAKVVFMNSEDHDMCVSVTSHLPHVLAASLVEIVSKYNIQDKRTADLIAGSFRDLTRISDSDPLLWASICNKNRTELSKSIGGYMNVLKDLQKSLGSYKNLYKFFNKAKNNRWKLLKSSQKKKFLPH